MYKKNILETWKDFVIDSAKNEGIDEKKLIELLKDLALTVELQKDKIKSLESEIEDIKLKLEDPNDLASRIGLPPIGHM